MAYDATIYSNIIKMLAKLYPTGLSRLLIKKAD